MVSQPQTPPPFGDKNASVGILATVILSTVLCIVLVTLRFMTRIWIVKRVGLDDWCNSFAMVSMVRSDASSQELNNILVWKSDWDVIGGRRDFVGLWPTRVLLDPTSISRVFEIRIRRMASGKKKSLLRTRLSKTEFDNEKTFATLTFTKLSICFF